MNTRVLQWTLTAFLSMAAGMTLHAEDAQDVTIKDTDWCTVEVPKTAKVGEKVTAKIKIKENVIKQESELRVDMHMFVGATRKPGAGRARPVVLKVDQGSEQTVSFTFPKDASAITFVCYVLPAGKTGWKDKTHSAEAGVKAGQ